MARPAEKHVTGAVVEIAGLRKSFGGLRALDDISLQVQPGEVLGIIGPNGAGKTALINTMTGFYRADSGVIRFFGVDITRISMHGIGRLGIARTFQNIRIFRRLSVLENVMAAQPAYARAPLRAAAGLLRRRADIADALEFLRAVGLSDQVDRAAGTLSYGDARRLEVARSLATQPRLLLLDEPAAGMNEAESTSLIRTIESVRRRLAAIVLIEHDMTVVRRLADRLVALDAGRVIAEGKAQEVLSHPLVAEAYLGEDVGADASHT